jgi:hypothetical protein
MNIYAYVLSNSQFIQIKDPLIDLPSDVKNFTIVTEQGKPIVYKNYIEGILYDDKIILNKDLISDYCRANIKVVVSKNLSFACKFETLNNVNNKCKIIDELTYILNDILGNVNNNYPCSIKLDVLINQLIFDKGILEYENKIVAFYVSTDDKIIQKNYNNNIKDKRILIALFNEDKYLIQDHITLYSTIEYADLGICIDITMLEQ